jgi:hypothetical protein
MKIQRLARRLMTKNLRRTPGTGTIQNAPRLNLLQLEDRSVPAIGYFQGFDTDTTDWSAQATRVSSGTGGVTSHVGAFHAEITMGAFTRFNGYTSTFPPGGFSTINYVYLNVAGGNPNDTRFDYTSAINNPAGSHRRDFAFNVGFYNDSDSTGSGPRFVMTASNSTGRSSSFPKNPGRAPFAVTATGWYGFEHRFYDAGGGQLACQLTIRNASGTALNSWVLSDATDIIGTTVGGNRYGWFPSIEFAALRIDNTAQFSTAVPASTYVDDSWVGLPYGVDPDGAGPANSIGVDSFTTIQSGINAVSAGGTVTVAAGTYAEDIVVNKPVSLLGAQAGVQATGSTRAGGESVIAGTGTSSSFVVTVQADNVAVDGFKITPANLARDGINVRTGSTPKPGDPSIGGYRAGIDLVNNWIQVGYTSALQKNGIVFGEHTSNANVSINGEIQDVNIARNYIDMVTTATSGSGPRGLVFTNQFRNSGATIRFTDFVVDQNTVIASAAGASTVGMFASAAQGTFRFDNASLSANTFRNSVTGINVGSIHSSSITGNTIQDTTSVGAILGLIDSTVENNLFQRNAFYGLGLWGGGFGTTPSSNTVIKGNTFRYNDYVLPGGVNYSAGLVLRAGGTATTEDSGTTGVAAGTITLEGNTFTDSGANGSLPSVAIVQRSFGTTLDAVNVTTPNTFNGVALTGATSTTDLLTMADRVADAVDFGGYGVVNLKAGNQYVTPNSFFPPVGTTTANIQRAVNISAPGDTIELKAGAYSGDVSIGTNLTVRPAGAGVTGVVAVAGNVAFNGGTYRFDINGTSPGTGYDQFDVTGTVNLTGSTLSLNQISEPPVATAVVLIQNDSTDPVTGTFAGLAEGAIVTVAGTSYKISYVGGTGNDVVLTRNLAPIDLSLNNSDVDENSLTGTLVGFLATADSDVGDSFVYTFATGAGDADNGAFMIAGDQLLTDSSFDFETKSSYTVRIRSTDLAGEFVERAFTITVVNVNEQPTGITVTSPLSVAEDAVNGTPVGSVAGIDPDLTGPFGTLEYSLTDDAGGLFAIDPLTGVVTVADQFLLDHETNPTPSITVRVTDGGSPGLFHEETFTVSVLNVNETPYAILSAGLSLPENSPNNAVAGSVTGFDFDTVAPFNTLTYSLADNAGGLFAINALNGAIRVVNGSLLNYEVATDYQIMVRVTDGGGLFIEVPFAVVIVDVNEAPTAINGTPTSVAENSPNGTSLGTVTGVDPDTASPFNTLGYSLSDDAGGRFAIDSSTGEITVANGSLLNFEANASHTITVVVTDGGGLTFSKPYTITVTNVNEAPTGIQLLGTTLPENAGTNFLVGTFTTSDQDTVNGDMFTYTLVSGGPDNGFFDILGNQLVARGSLNFESQNVFQINVRTLDSGGLSFTQAFTITVTNVNEAPTNINAPALTVAENPPNGTSIGTATGIDPDTVAPFNTLSYSLTDSAGGRFAIDSSTGAITVANGSLLNFEANTSHSITVLVTDGGGLTFSRTFTVSVTDVNEAPIDITGTLTVAENPVNGTAVGTVTGIDPDTTAPNNTLSYSLANSAGGRFAINALTGAVTVANGSLLNFEANTSHSITVLVTDGGGLTFSKVLTVTVTDVNEAPFDIISGVLSVAENSPNGTAVGTVTGIDPDTAAPFNTLSYSLANSAGGRFAINALTGAISVANGSLLNFEANTSHSITVLVTDGGGLTFSKSFTVNVTNVNETPTNFTLSPSSLPENAGAAALVGSFSTLDPDFGDSFTYTFRSGVGDADNGAFTIVNGQLFANSSFDFETKNSYSIRVRSTDQGGEFIARIFTITVTDANDAPININATALSVPENSANGTIVGTVTGVDPDTTAPNNTLTYSLTNTAGGRFTINPSNGVVTVANGSLLDFEANATHTITVLVTDGGGLTFSKSFTVNVVNVNEAPLNSVPGAQTVNEDTPLAFNGPRTISVANLEGATATVQLTVANGTLSVSLAGGAAISAGANGTPTLTLLGNQTQINAALATLVYQGAADYFGSDTLTVFTQDADVVPQSDTDTVPVTVNAVQDIVNDSLLLNGVNPVTANLITGTNGASADTFSNPGRTLTAVSAPGKGNVTFAANGTITYTPFFSFTGSDTFTYTVTSGGKSETGTVTVGGPSQSTFLTSSSISGQPVRQYSVSGFGAPATATGLSITLTGASRVAYGDVNGDGTEDIIVGTVSGSTSVVRVYNGKNSALLNSFAPFVAGSVSGIYVAAGDMNGDGRAEVVVSNGSAGTGANSNTRVYDGAYISSGKVVVSPSVGGTVAAQGRLRDFFAFTNATGSSVGNGTSFTANTGATVAMGDFNGDGLADLVTGVTSGGSARVNIFDAKALLVSNPTSAWPRPNVDLATYNTASTTGVFVAAGDVNGDGRAELVTGPFTGGSNIRVFSFQAGSKLVPTAAHASFTNSGGNILTTTFSGTAPTLSADFYVGSFGSANVGVRVAVRDLNNDGYGDIIYTFGANQPGFASTFIGGIDGNTLRTAYAVSPYQQQFAPPPGSDYTLLTAAYAGVSTGAFVA